MPAAKILPLASTISLLFVLTLPISATAQELPDGGLPDASVGQGGADRDNEEGDTMGGPCLSSRECDRGFACSADGRCVPTKVRDLGCQGAPGLLSVGALVAWLLRRVSR